MGLSNEGGLRKRYCGVGGGIGWALVYGSWWTPEGRGFSVARFPMTSNLLQRAFDDAWVGAHKAKVLYFRQRPDGTKENSSYPSGHAVEGQVLACVMSALDPKHAQEAERLGREIADNRL